MPKSGEKLDATIEHLKRTNLYPLAQQYKELRTRLISYQLQHLEAIQEVFSQSQDSQCGAHTAQQRWMDDGDLLADMMLDCVDIYKSWT